MGKNDKNISSALMVAVQAPTGLHSVSKINPES